MPPPDKPGSSNPGSTTGELAASRFIGLIAPFRYPDLRVLWISTLSNQLGQGMQQVMLGWLVYDLTGSAGMVGTAFAARSAPNLLVGLIAGPITDRLDRRTVMRVSVWGMMLGTLAVSMLLFSENLNVWHLLAITFLLGTFQAFYLIARQVYVYDVVGPSGALEGLAAISLAQRIGQFIGALLAGGLIQWQGPAVSFLVMSASYVFGASTLYVLRRVGDSAPGERESIAENILNYFRALKSNRVMTSLMISTAGVEILGFSHQVMLPVLAKEVLGVDAVGLGVLTAFRFFGGAVGVTLLAMMGQIKRPGVLLLVVLGLFGLAQVMLGQSLTFWMALVFVALVNMMASITDVLHQTLLQRSVSNEQRGRAMGSWVVGTGTAPAGQLQIGYLAELSNTRIALLINGVGLATLALVMAVLMPRLRRL